MKVISVTHGFNENNKFQNKLPWTKMTVNAKPAGSAGLWLN